MRSIGYNTANNIDIQGFVALFRYKWDTIQREFTCCGGYGHTVGYVDWKHTLLGGATNSVPDSCCLNETPGALGIFSPIFAILNAIRT